MMANIEMVIPPSKTTVPDTSSCAPNQRDRHLEKTTTKGRLEWQTATGNAQRDLVGATASRYQFLTGHRSRS
jgi:hypothetical protein